MPGPIPKPEHELTRPRARRGKDQVAVTRGVRREAVWPDPDPGWVSFVADLFLSAKESGQADFYQQSDIAMLYMICVELDRYYHPYEVHDAYGEPVIDAETGEVKTRMPKPSGQMFQALMSSLQSLLLSEGDRRRVRIELAEAPVERPQLASVARLQYADVAGEPTGTEG